MVERTEHVVTPDGTMEVFIAHPDAPGPFPVLVQLMDIGGMRDELRNHARRAAVWGYYVLQPDLLYRDGIKGPMDVANPEIRAILLAAAKNLTDDRARSDIRALLQSAERDSAARKGEIGIYGFCMGGRLAVVLAQSMGWQVVAVSSIHPGFLVDSGPASPHRNLDQVKAELYFSIADQDFMATPEQMVELETALGTRGIRYQLEWAPARHGFMMPSRKDAYVEATAEKVWGRIKALFDRTLK